MRKARWSSYILQKLQQSKLSTLMVTCFIAFNLLLVSIVVWLSYQSFSAVTFTEISKARLALLNESTRRGFDFITGVTGTAYSLASNRELSSLLETTNTGRLAQIHQRREVSRILDHTIVVSEGITSVELYTDAFNEVTVTMADHIYTLDTLANESWFSALEKADASWVPLRENESGQSLVGYAQRIYDSRGGTVAYVLIRLSRADIVRRFADVPMVLDGNVLLVDTAGNVVMQMGKAAAAEGDAWSDQAYTDSSSSIIDSDWILEHVHPGEDGFEVVSGQPGGAQLVLYSKPAMLQWRLVQTIPVYTLLSPVRQAGWQILGIAVLGLLCSAVLAYLFVRQIIRPLRQLIKRMRQLEKGDFNTRVQLSFTEEYAHLAYGFNHMASQLTGLMEQVKDESRAKREAQTSLLEAQIKPHFLYNTLDMIHWRALDYEAKDISRMIVQLSKLLRIGLSGGKLFIRVRDELEHARCYVSIQSERLPFAIQYQERIDPRIRGCYIPKIILQPFIENAVMHGHSNEETLRIQVHIDQIDEPVPDIRIRITDNGQGLPNEWSIEGSKGIGVRNVHERIQLYCGQRYGVQLSNRGSGGVEVQITLPRIETEEQLNLWLDGEKG
ncbi:sensor histidine kinase [Paenibacillus silvae]|uniref:sensor histidine kinase n=1 Tax=Paenibacillus silvae TaxID=1325358 RepID=UPI0011A53E1C|nr:MULTISPECIES: sensor histidine kinase [Paenibacillus]MCK6077760.1 sensor histidine kinase [Paenibacillus silvae]MCK6151959.1 sensor histidine kinase [Paenibacillus silvae]MCK6270644.1 sensor histidine kinase [Paenibacillus silvae]